MPWCPKCKSEFRSGFTVCNSCGVRLVDRLSDLDKISAASISEEQSADEADENTVLLHPSSRRRRALGVLRGLIILFLSLTVILLIASNIS